MGLENCVQFSNCSNVSAFAVKCNAQKKLMTLTPCRKQTNLPTFQFLSLSSSSIVVFRPSTSLKRLTICCSASSSNAVTQVEEVTSSSWESVVLNSPNPVVVAFWAPWCGPCKIIAPVMYELAKEYSGKISCYKLNTDESPNIATQYNIRSVPTVLFFKNGEMKESIVGAVSKSTFITSIDKYLDY